MNKRYSAALSKTAVVVLLCAVLVGNAVTFPQLHLAGIVPTLYRVVVVLLALYYFVRRFILKHHIVPLTKFFWLTVAMMLFWIAYAGVQLFVIDGLDRREGLKEIMYLGLGLLSIYCLYEANTSASQFRLITNTVRVLGVGLLLFALFEITFGIHLPTSRYYDPAFLQSKAYIDRYGSGQIVWHTATGPFYNQNDFLFALGLCTPFFYPAPTASLKEKILCYVGLGMLFALMMMDGSFIVSVAMLAGVLMQLLLTKASIKKHLVIWPSAFLIQEFISKWFYLLLQNTFLLFNRPAGSANGNQNLVNSTEGTQFFSGSQSLANEINNQESNLVIQQGSSFKRLTIYKDGFKAFLESKGVGLGPNGFTQYFLKHPSEGGLVNPHNWLLEVLVQFGVLVFFAYAAIMLAAFIQMVRMYLNHRRWELTIVASMFAVFAVGCVAPSSLIGAPHQWLPLAFGVSMLRPSYFNQD